MTNNFVRARVVKLGGSLLSWPDWPTAFANWYGQQPAAMTQIVVGGGAAVDALRLQQHQRKLTDEEAHWQAIDTMSQNARLVAQTLGCPLTSFIHDPPVEEPRCQLIVLDTRRLLRTDASLPTDWSFTSDSIAAWVATWWRRLVVDSVQLQLLKSCRPDDLQDVASWVADGLVDQRFSNFAAGLNVRWVCLHDHATKRHDWVEGVHGAGVLGGVRDTPQETHDPTAKQRR